MDAKSPLQPAGFKKSDIRIYCGNDARWSLVPDLAGKKTKKNSKQPLSEQRWEDKATFMFASGRVEGLGCQAPGTLAQTYKIKDLGNADKGVSDGQNAKREVITVSLSCNSTILDIHLTIQ